MKVQNRKKKKTSAKKQVPVTTRRQCPRAVTGTDFLLFPILDLHFRRDYAAQFGRANWHTLSKPNATRDHKNRLEDLPSWRSIIDFAMDSPIPEF